MPSEPKAATPPDYQLVWADEFNRDGPPDHADWTFETGFVRNEELQWYQPDNAFCKDGCLIIEGRREQKPNPKFDPHNNDWTTRRSLIEYTSSCVTTRGLHSWMYGRFEVRARIKVQPGLWPTIWFLGIDGEWPSNGEIDLMESYRGKLLANACWGTDRRFEAKWNSSERPFHSFDDPEWNEKFHLWRMDWDSESIRLHLDDRLLNAIDVTQTFNPTDKGPANPFRQPHYLLLNLAIGGKEDPSRTAFPTRFEIDYVRVYQGKN